MDYLHKHRKLIIITAAFIVFMLLCTMISKSVYASTLPVIRTAKPEKREIGHQVEAAGMVEQSLEYAISVQTGLKIETVYTSVGNEIAEGTVLFDIDLEDLEKLIREKELDIKKLELEISALKQNMALGEQERKLAQERAGQDYQIAGVQADRDLKNAETNEKEASEKLKAHQDSRPAVTSREERAKQQELYSQWEQELAGEQAACTTLTTQLEENAGIIEELLKQLNGGESVSDSDRLSQELAGAREYSDRLSRELALRKGNVQRLEGSEPGIPDYSQEDARLSQWETEKKELEKAVSQASRSRTDATLDVNRSLTDAARKVEDSQSAEKEDVSLELNQLELQYKKELLEQYREILEREGKILSEAPGVVTNVLVSAGERTSDGAALVYANKEENLRFRAVLTKEQKKHVDMGSQVTLSLGGSKGSIKGQVDYLGEIPSSGNYEAIILLDEGEGSMGQSGTMTVDSHSESFLQCILVNALHTEKDKTFIYVVRSQMGILGEELAAEKRFVKVVDQNDKYAALEDGNLAEGEEVIVSSSKALEDGDVVRYGL